MALLTGMCVCVFSERESWWRQVKWMALLMLSSLKVNSHKMYSAVSLFVYYIHTHTRTHVHVYSSIYIMHIHILQLYTLILTHTISG